MIDTKWISSWISETKAILGFSVAFGAIGYWLSDNNIAIGAIVTILALLFLVVLDMDRRAKILESELDSLSASIETLKATMKGKKGAVNYTILFIIFIILLLILILSSRQASPLLFP